MSPDPVYESDPHAKPDEAFEPGTLAHLAAGNHGRLLDARRTPVVVTGLDVAAGMFELEITAFEDEGARWEIELEQVGSFQFTPGEPRLDACALRELETAVERFNVTTSITCRPEDRAETEQRIAEQRPRARGFAAGAAPVDALEAYLDRLALGGLEAAFAERWVSNPSSGELVKGHAMVLARLGLCPYYGNVQRSPDLFAGEWSEGRRAEHVVARLAFVRELYSTLGEDRVVLYRGLSAEAPLQLPRPRSFVSATFDPRVAEAHFAGGPRTVAAALYRQLVPAERLFMTHVETRAFNRQFRESEAVVLADPASPLF